MPIISNIHPCLLLFPDSIAFEQHFNMSDPFLVIGINGFEEKLPIGLP